MKQPLCVAVAGTAYATRRYRNMRANARIFTPRAATGGFPYNLRSVAECDPLPQPRPKPVPREIKVAREYGYDA